MNRTLGAFEQVFWLEGQTLPMNVVLCASVEGEINLYQISEAIEQVQSRHPLLGARLVPLRVSPQVRSQKSEVLVGKALKIL